MASLVALQYLPVVASQVQTGCAHFVAGFVVMSSSSFEQGVFDPGCIIGVSKMHCCALKNTFKFRRRTYPVASTSLVTKKDDGGRRQKSQRSRSMKKEPTADDRRFTRKQKFSY